MPDPEVLQYQCCFCEKGIDRQGPDVGLLSYTTCFDGPLARQHTQGIFCNARLRAALHRSVALYVLDLLDSSHFAWEDAADEYASLVTAWWAGGYKKRDGGVEVSPLRMGTSATSSRESSSIICGPRSGDRGRWPMRLAINKCANLAKIG